MNITLILVGGFAFLVYQLVAYVTDVQTGDKTRKLVWHNPFLLLALVVIAAFVGILVALISQDQTLVDAQEAPLPLSFSFGSTKEWIRAILLGFGAMPILKKGSLDGFGNIGVQNTGISMDPPRFRDYLKSWWRSQ